MVHGPRSARQACSGLHGYAAAQAADLQYSVLVVLAWPLHTARTDTKADDPACANAMWKMIFLYIMYLSDLTCHLATSLHAQPSLAARVQCVVLYG